MSLSRLTVLAILAVPFFACGSGEEDPGTSAEHITAGSCALATPKNTVCAAVIDPACGCDGKTYNNACEAARVVTSSTPGACETSDAGVACKLASPKAGLCPAVIDPVCGCDGKTYNNACDADHTITGWTPGACGQSDAGAACKLASPKGGFCPAVIDPVCGCDGKTYNNACAADHDITSWTPGACGQSDAGACKLASPKGGLCPAVFDPVCGCDGKTYTNACAADHDVTSWTPGACKQ